MQESSGAHSTPTPLDMSSADFRAAKLAVNSAAQRQALLYACQRVLDPQERARGQSGSDGDSARRQSEQHVAEALALEAELERGCSTVAVGLGIVGTVGGALAELIETEMRERAHSGDIAPAGVQIRRAAGLMWTLVALDAEVEHEIMPGVPATLEPAPISPDATGV